MHTNSAFDELGLVGKLATSSRTSYRETPISNNNRGCKGLSSLRCCDQVSQLKSPLDSADIYPITWSTSNHLETGYKGRPSKAILFPGASILTLMMMLHASFKTKCLT
jgi:hypothetical protein